MTTEIELIHDDEDLDPMHSYENEIYICLTNLKDEIELQLNDIMKMDDIQAANAEIKRHLTILSQHMAGFLSAVCFDLVQDPENWLKHTFYESLKHIQHRRKDAIDSLVNSGPENTTEH